MGDKDETGKHSGEASSGAPPPEGVQPVHSGATEPATAKQLKEVEKEMTGFEKSTLRWARTAVIMSGLAAAFVCLQWVEMCKGGNDTHELATQAKNQADRTKEVAEAAKKSADAAYLSAEALRPHLAIVLLTPQPLTVDGLPLDSGRLHVQFQVPNYGSSLAQNIQICEFDGVMPPEKIARLPYGNCKSSATWNYGSTVISPVIQLRDMQAPGWGMDGSKPITERETDDLKVGKRVAVFSVLATYHDAAGAAHHAEACIVFTLQQKWGNQTIGSWGSEPCAWDEQND